MCHGGLKTPWGQGSRAATEGGARRRLSMDKGCWHHMKVTSHMLLHAVFLVSPGLSHCGLDT